MVKLGKYKLILVTVILISSMMIGPTTAQDNPEFVVTYAMPYDFSEFSQFTSQSYATNQWLSAISGGLYSRSAESDRNYDLELASQFPVISPDGLVYVVTLRDNLMFSDGTALTAYDVVFTYHSLLNIEINFNSYAIYAAYFDSTDSIKAIDDQTVEFTLNQKWAGFMKLLSAAIQPRAHFAERLESKDYDWNADDCSDAISAGPFMVESFDKTNMEIIMIRNPNYWNSQNVVSDVLLFKKIDEKAAAVSALDKNEIQIFDSQYVAAIDALNDIDGIVDFLTPSPSHHELSLNHLHPYYGTGENLTIDNKVEGAKAIRKAMSHLLDRNFMVTGIWEGFGIPLPTIVSPAMIGWNPDIEYRKYSLTTAKELMIDAGFNFDDLGTPDDEGNYNESFFSITMLSPNTSVKRVSWWEVLLEDLPKIGIGVKGELATDWATIIPRTFGSDIPPPLFDEGGYDIFAVGYSWDIQFNPYGLYESYSIIPNGGNFYNFKNSEYDLLSEQLNGEFDVDKRFDLMYEIQDFYYEWEIVIPAYTLSEHWAFRDDLRGYDALLISITQGEWDKIGTQEAIDAIKPNGSFLDFNLMSLIAPFLLISVIYYQKSQKYLKINWN